MKIAIDIRNIGKGRTGDEVVFFELVRHLAQIDAQNEYHLLIDMRADDALRRIETQLDITGKENFQLVPCGTGNKFVWNAITASRYCRRKKIDIYHTQYIIPFFMPSWTKIVTHIHDVSFCAHKELIKKSDAFFLNILIPRAIKKSHAVVAVSQFTKDEIVRYYHCPQEKVCVIPNAVSMYCDPLLRAEDVRAKYHVPEMFIMALGTMQPRKNISFLIEVFVSLAQERGDVSLVLVGKKDHNFDLMIQRVLGSYPQVADRVIFTGYVSDAEKCCLYKMARVFAFPSIYEGFGIPILEAFSVGTPVVASDILPHREVAGEGALYCDPQSIDQWKKMLYDVLDNDKMRKDLQKGSQEQIIKFSWKESAQKLVSLYKSLCG
ncbi:MAG: glycosyltransferase family 1 protein [Parcubacteria group bacterium]|jgi:glycosyltransferase involved in cell wall biosynthesis